MSQLGVFQSPGIMQSTPSHQQLCFLQPVAKHFGCRLQFLGLHFAILIDGKEVEKLPVAS